MSKLTIGLGAALTALGQAAYFGTGRSSVTAQIPAFFGLPLIALGVLAGRENLRVPALYGAAGLGLLGLLGTVRSLPRTARILSGGDDERPAAAVTQSAMAVLCAGYLAVSTRAHFAARRQG
ncbi:MAG TPA: hypothetical protein VFS21_12400 [Roseiflexaceae bacterium]|nr:hypothetical protein [Roseiflexaceae bacterium]